MRSAPQHVFEELKAREPIFHHPELGTAPEDFDAIIDQCFWEVGASGHVYTREVVLAELRRRHSSGHIVENWQVDECACLALADDLFLFTYRLAQGERLSRRATLWQSTPHGWKAIYHQGTLIERS
jgi:hypothetical protein